MLSKWTAALLRIFPPAPGADLVSHRFAAIAVSLGLGLALVTAPLFARTNASLAFVVCVFGVLEVLTAWLFRTTRAAALGFWLTQVFVIFLYLNVRWTETTLDLSLAMWLTVLPLTGMLYGGTRAGLISLGLGVAAAVVMIFAPVPDLYFREPVSLESGLLRVASFFFASFLLASSWQTLRRDALARAEAAAHARSLFLANMSHELRTPMNGVLGLTELLLSSDPKDDQRETLLLIRRSGEQLVALINDVIDFTRLDAQRMPLKQEPFELRAALSDVLAITKPTLGRDVTLGSTVEPDVPAWVTGDGVRLRQVLTNLLGNAAKFTTKGQVTLAVSKQGARLRFVVKDTGVGIAAESLQRLFMPFEQAEAEANRRYGGSGLGLTISKRLVELMGGTLALESTLGEGTTVTVDLALPVAAPTDRDEPATGLTRALRLRVLVVDDNEVNLRVAGALLAKEGCETTLVRDGLEAVRAVEAGSFDLVLMDCHMPVLDGFEATRRIRALAGAAHAVPIVALTASVLPEEVQRCLDSGMNDCLAKPISLPALRAALTAHARD